MCRTRVLRIRKYYMRAHMEGNFYVIINNYDRVDYYVATLAHGIKMSPQATVLALLYLVYALALAQTQSDIACSAPAGIQSTCVCQTDGGKSIDLRPLAKSDGTAKYVILNIEYLYYSCTKNLLVNTDSGHGITVRVNGAVQQGFIQVVVNGGASFSHAPY